MNKHSIYYGLDNDTTRKEYRTTLNEEQIKIFILMFIKRISIQKKLKVMKNQQRKLLK